LAGLLALVGIVWTAAPAAAQTENGLAIDSMTIYSPNLDNQEVDVDSTYTMTNVQADEVTGDSVRSFFFTKWVVAIPATAIDFTAFSQGLPLQASRETAPGAPDIDFATIDLPSNLNFGRHFFGKWFRLFLGSARTRRRLMRPDLVFLFFVTRSA